MLDEALDRERRALMRAYDLDAALYSHGVFEREPEPGGPITGAGALPDAQTAHGAPRRQGR